MEISGDYILDAPQELTWKALQDPKILTSVMPGCEDFNEIGEYEYFGYLNVNVGPVQGRFASNIKLSDLVAPESYHIHINGKGTPGFVEAKGGLKLSGQGDKTYMTYQGEAHIGGRIATVGQRLLETSAKSIIRQSLEGLNAYLIRQVATMQPADGRGPGSEDPATPATGEPAGYAPPSQTTVAKNVFKDVLGEMIPPQYRRIIAGVGVVLVILILYLVLRR